jgi:hypothetical protein
MIYETILPGSTGTHSEEDPVINHLIELRSRLLTQEDVEATMDELRWYLDLRDHAESIPSEDHIVWKELHRTYGKLSDDQIIELISRLEQTEFGDYINQ